VTFSLILVFPFSRHLSSCLSVAWQLVFIRRCFLWQRKVMVIYTMLAKRIMPTRQLTVSPSHDPSPSTILFSVLHRKRNRKFDFQFYMIRKLWVDCMYRCTGGPPYSRVTRSQTYRGYVKPRITPNATHNVILT